MALVDDMRKLTYENIKETDEFKFIFDKIKGQALQGKFQLEIEACKVSSRVCDTLRESGFIVDLFYKCLKNNKNYSWDWAMHKYVTKQMEEEGITPEDLFPMRNISWKD